MNSCYINHLVANTKVDNIQNNVAVQLTCTTSPLAAIFREKKASTSRSHTHVNEVFKGNDRRTEKGIERVRY